MPAVQRTAGILYGNSLKFPVFSDRINSPIKGKAILVSVVLCCLEKQ